MVKDSACTERSEERNLLLVIFFSSFSTLAYEIALTRIFSISLWYHFAFMIISIAMLGIGASGTILSLYPKLRSPSNISLYSVMLGLSISMSYLLSNQIPFDPVRLSWERVQLFYIALYYITLAIPFFFTGLIVATAFAFLSKKSGLIYSADLLGAGMGSMGVLYLMSITGPETAVFILSMIVLSASFFASPSLRSGLRLNASPALFSLRSMAVLVLSEAKNALYKAKNASTAIICERSLRIISLILISLNLSLLFLQPPFVTPRMSPYKGLQMALKYPGARHLKTSYSPYSRIDMIKSPAVRFAPGLSLKYLYPLPEQIGVSIDGSDINAITDPHDQKALEFLRYLPSHLPYEISQKDDVLILDPKGGLQVLIAQTGGAKRISKVESNPLLIKVIRDDYRDFAGDILKENTWTGLGRTWLKAAQRDFDIIDISLMGTMPSGPFGISEDYRFTVEAFREYIRHLKTHGILSINLFILPPPRIELRLLNTIITSLKEMGIDGPERHIVAIRSWGSLSLLVKRSPFIPDEIRAIRRFLQDRRFDFIYYPGIKEEESNLYVKMPLNEYFYAFRSIIDPGTREEFIKDYSFDIRPVRDDNPFFHYYLRFKNIRSIYKIMGEKWQYFIEEGYILPAVFIQVLFVSLVLIILPVIGRAKVKTKIKTKADVKLLPYFAFLAVGFMFVEMTLIQRAILSLENPFYAFATVLTSILIGSGIGSLLSYRVSALRRPFISLLLASLIIFYSLLLPAIFDILSPYPVHARIVSLFLILIPLGFFMGIPFPLGLRILGSIDNSLIPWAWAINGCLSVLSPIIAIMLAMTAGFNMVLWSGALSYGMAFIALTSAFRSHRS